MIRFLAYDASHSLSTRIYETFMMTIKQITPKIETMCEAKVVDSTSLMMASFFLSANVKIQAKISARQCTFRAQLLAGVVPTSNRELSFGRVQREYCRRVPLIGNHRVPNWVREIHVRHRPIRHLLYLGFPWESRPRLTCLDRRRGASSESQLQPFA